MMILVVTAVAAERDAVLAGVRASPRPDSVDVLVGGVGAAAAAARTATALCGVPYRQIVSAGIGGGFSGRADIGDVALATRSIAADLGAESAEGFLSIAELGFGVDGHDADADLLGALRAALPGAAVGAVLTVATVTGSAARAQGLAARHPTAVAEAMEGYGVATAAAGVGVPFAEIRTISNLVGPRDRAAWRIGAALEALTRIGAALATLDG